MPQAVEELSVTRARLRASRPLEFRSGDARVCAEHELFSEGAPTTAMRRVADQRCYVCRKPVPTSREKVKEGRWRDIMIGGIAIGALCADCSL
jgi:hypothetical protein